MVNVSIYAIKMFFHQVVWFSSNAAAHSHRRLWGHYYFLGFSVTHDLTTANYHDQTEAAVNLYDQKGLIVAHGVYLNATCWYLLHIRLTFAGWKSSLV